jgi:hypothetical protein
MAKVGDLNLTYHVLAMFVLSAPVQVCATSTRIATATFIGSDGNCGGGGGALVLARPALLYWSLEISQTWWR